MWRSAVVPILVVAGSFLLPVSGVSSSHQRQVVDFRIHYTLVEELRYEVPLPDSPGHWLRAAKFAGPVQGGPFGGGWAEELGLHEVFPGREGIGGPIYHVITAPDESSLTLRGDRRLVTFDARAGEGPLNVYAGTWTVLGGTGVYADSQVAAPLPFAHCRPPRSSRSSPGFCGKHRPSAAGHPAEHQS